MTTATAARSFSAQDSWDVQALISRFYGALDEGDYETVVNCFHEEGVWHRQGKATAGRHAMLAGLQMRSATLVVQHLFGNCIFQPADDGRVKVRYVVSVFWGDARAARDGKPLMAVAPQVGFCDAEAVCQDGQWLLWSMRIRTPTFKSEAQPAA